MRIASRARTIAIVTATLTGCTGVHRTPVGPTCVSCKPYYCRGSWHHPQLYYEYDEVGLASWYGDDCHGKKKATGEPFDKMAMTAAHKTLPLPSVVKVTSLVTGKSVVVIIDDRGPYVYAGRIIDLSYGAAMRLGIHNRKPSKVRVEVLVEDSVKLSRYIAAYCCNRRDPFGRTWNQLYFQEINRMAMPVPMYTSEASNYKSSIRRAHHTNHRRPVAGHSKARKSLIGHINKL
ncbi:MAG: septal ring lytic transglycosylase RlpA family protein [Holosporales bacterium]|jgi:rare lipoprotein A (peptidoglycan hydrolase)|nr:septal ring lytic transglycosylase RlpA family protein [Holosporales bacterium]